MMGFKEVSAEELQFNPFTKIGKEWMLVTAGDEEKHNTMTASWGGMGIMWGKKRSERLHPPAALHKRICGCQ